MKRDRSMDRRQDLFTQLNPDENREQAFSSTVDQEYQSLGPALEGILSVKHS